VGLEIAEQAAAMQTPIDVLLDRWAAGGLMAGVSVALRARSPATRIWGVEPEGFDDARLSLAAGRAARPRRRATLPLRRPGGADDRGPDLSAAGGAPGLRGGVSDAEVAVAHALRLRDLKLVVEPGGAVALAALLAGRIDVSGLTAAIILSGGNVDPALFRRVLAEEI